MKIKNGFVAKEIAGQYVVVALGQASKIFNGIIKLNESGKFIRIVARQSELTRMGQRNTVSPVSSAW